MAKFQKSTLRRMQPVTKKYAKLINELDSTVRRATKLIKDIEQLELDSTALWGKEQARIKKAKERGIDPNSLTNLFDSHILSKVTKERK